MSHIEGECAEYHHQLTDGTVVQTHWVDEGRISSKNSSIIKIEDSTLKTAKKLTV